MQASPQAHIGYACQAAALKLLYWAFNTAMTTMYTKE